MILNSLSQLEATKCYLHYSVGVAGNWHSTVVDTRQ